MRELGQLGRFHRRCYVLVAIAGFSAAIYGINYVFLAADVPYRCVMPECNGEVNTTWSQGRGSPLQRCYRRVDSPCGPPPLDFPADSEELRLCTRFEYASNESIVAEFDLACQDWKRTLVGTVHNVGMLVSVPLIGYVSDRWGRKRALVLSCTLVGAVGTLKAFSISYEMYIVIEFLETIAGASAFPAAYIITIELLGQDKRVLTTAFLGIVLVLGGLCFALLAKILRYWRTFIIVTYPPSLLFITYIYFLPESIRWLLSKGRKREALRIVTKAAETNGVTLTEELLRQLSNVDEDEKNVVHNESAQGRGVWKQVLRSPVILWRLAVCSCWWITCTFVFYGLAINSVSLAGDKYTNYMLVVSVEVVAVVTNALVLDRFGRKRTLCLAFLVCGVSLIAIAFIPKYPAWVTTALYLVGKIAITQAFNGIYMYTSELFPTHARHSLLGFCSMLGRLGSIVAPQMPLLALYVEWLPTVLFGTSALLAGALMLTTPETLHARLPDTIRDAEMLGRPLPAPSISDQHVTSRL
ncbi:unnamed protein product [Leptosia nina]|uniref:Major facilitator superfamily (MFS) profile domain-containing protein n=1 Tax=Leptosia nina TaxID=320188 RepID=A0AAV1K2Y2_9NEOP